MEPVWKFRLIAFAIVVVVGAVAISTLLAEILRAAPVPLPTRAASAVTSQQISSTRLAHAVAPYRSDLSGDYALALAGAALKPNAPAQDNDAAKAQVRSALKLGPHDSRMWLALALLQARRNPDDALIAEALKMSYLTGPSRPELIATRLDVLTSNNSLQDAELNELARSDVRAILTQRPDQRQSLIEDYRRASGVGKVFLQESAKMLDPAFADQLRNTR